MSEQAVRVVEQVQELLTSEDIVADLNDDTPTFRAQMMNLVEPEFEVIMVATPTGGGARVERRGIHGFRDAWLDWTDAFASYRIEIEEMIEAGDRVVTLVRQGGMTKTGGVEIEAAAAAVWTVRDNRVSGVEFHLDRKSALRAAGLA